ncbi:MAG: hypothetical protein WD825_14495 [Gemmatimonadaceae bacterium]
MNTRIRLVLASVFVLVACDDGTVPPSSPGLVRVDASASIVSNNYPITFPSGIAWDANLLYVSTIDGFRDTYKIDPTTNAIVGTVPGGFNPRDVTWMWPSALVLADMDSFVSVRDQFSGAVVDSIPIPWRGGGIARWRDSLYVGNIDRDSILVIWYPIVDGSAVANPVIRKFASPVRPEALVADSSAVVPSIATLWALTPFDSDSLIYEMDLQGNLLRKCYTPYRPGPFGLGGVALVRDTFYIVHPQNGDPTLGTTIVRVAKTELVCVGPVVPVNDTIDIKPGHFPNRIHPGSNAKFKVAALTTPSRDATTLIPATVRFGRTGTEAPALSTSFQDVDSDGDIDVVFEFRTSATGILCGDTSARLTALTSTGPPFNGMDSILTIGCRP